VSARRALLLAATLGIGAAGLLVVVRLSMGVTLGSDAYSYLAWAHGLVQHGRTGWLVRAGEAPALAAAIRAVLDDGALAASVAAAARRRAAEEFSFVKQTEKLMRFYRSLLEAPDHAARGATATRSRP